MNQSQSIVRLKKCANGCILTPQDEQGRSVPYYEVYVFETFEAVMTHLKKNFWDIIRTDESPQNMPQ